MGLVAITLSAIKSLRAAAARDLRRPSNNKLYLLGGRTTDDSFYIVSFIARVIPCFSLLTYLPKSKDVFRIFSSEGELSFLHL